MAACLRKSFFAKKFTLQSGLKIELMYLRVSIHFGEIFFTDTENYVLRKTCLKFWKPKATELKYFYKWVNIFETTWQIYFKISKHIFNPNIWYTSKIIDISIFKV